MHVKYKVSISFSSKVMAKVKAFLPQTDTRTHKDWTKTRYPRIPFRRHIIVWLLSIPYIYNPNINIYSHCQRHFPCFCMMLQIRMKIHQKTSWFCWMANNKFVRLVLTMLNMLLKINLPMHSLDWTFHILFKC